jgi:hypothetical protein
MRVFAKYFYGFSPEAWPAVNFSTETAARKFVEEAEGHPAIMVFMCANNANALKDERGLVLGYMEIKPEYGDSKGYLPAQTLAKLDSANPSKWPWAVPATRAWRLKKPYPKTADFIGKVPMKFAWELPDSISSKILALPNDIEKLGTAGHQADTSGLTKRGIRQRTRRKGPPPSTYEAMVIKSHSGPAYSYLLRFGEVRNVWKVGMCINVETRRKQINAYVPVEALDEDWQLVQARMFESAMKAYEFEQSVLAAAETSGLELSLTGERIFCDKSSILRTWDMVASRLCE